MKCVPPSTVSEQVIVTFLVFGAVKMTVARLVGLSKRPPVACQE